MFPYAAQRRAAGYARGRPEPSLTTVPFLYRARQHMFPTAPDGHTGSLAQVHPFADDGDDEPAGIHPSTEEWQPTAIGPTRLSTSPAFEYDALATIGCLVEGYARFLFSHEPSAEARGIDLDEVSRALNTVHPGIDTAGHVIAQIRTRPLRDRVSAWYRWIAQPPSRRNRTTDPVSFSFSTTPGSYGDGRASPDQTQMLQTQVAQRGVCVGTRRQSVATAQPLFYFKGAADRRMLADEVLGGAVSHGQLARWTRGDPDVRLSLASADGAVHDFFNRKVRRYAPPDCAPWLLPDFARLFDMRFCLVPVAGDVVLVGTVTSPVVAALLGMANPVAPVSF